MTVTGSNKFIESFSYPVLRLKQFNEGESKYRVELTLEQWGQPRRSATAHFTFELSLNFAPFKLNREQS